MWCSRYFLSLVLLASLVLSVLPFSAASELGACSTCPSGHYCEKAVDAPHLATPTPCPAGTYSASTGRSSAQTCRACPAGYLCATAGITHFDSVRCPAGAFCPEGTAAAVPCPVGTFQPSTGASSLDECLPCPAGAVCAAPATLVPAPCPLGKLCPAKTWEPLQCPPGHYCPPASTASASAALHGASAASVSARGGGFEAIPCPAGFYCGPIDASAAVPCPVGTFCPARAAAPEPCPAGHSARVGPTVFDGARDSLDAACAACAPGTWQRRGDTTGQCEPCPAGHTCPGGGLVVAPAAAAPRAVPVSTYGHDEAEMDTMCPAGHYCPAGSAVPVACPAGSFNPLRGAGAPADCLPCPADTFSAAAAATSCRACPAHATAAAGSAACACAAAGRVFFPADRSCRCKPGFELSPLAALAEAKAKAAAAAAAAVAARTPLTARLSRAFTKLTSGVNRAAADADFEDGSEADADREDDSEAAAAQAAAEAADAVSLSDIELSAYDCRETVYERCAAHEARAANGKCVDRSGAHCAQVCGTAASASTIADADAPLESADTVLQFIDHSNGNSRGNMNVNGTFAKRATSARAHGHYFDAKLGICQCRDAATLIENVCDADCRARAPVLALAPSLINANSNDNGNGKTALDVVVTLPNGANAQQFDQYRISAAQAGFTASSLPTVCNSNSDIGSDSDSMLCRAHLASVSPRGVGALFSLPATIATALSAAYPDSTALQTYLARAGTAAGTRDGTRTGARALFATGSSDIVVYPVVFCLKPSESLVFEFSPASNSYPTYDAANLLNTNSAFDYSLFTNLPAQFPTPASVTTAIFGFTFTDPGTYVFVDSADADKMSIVRVLDAAQTCPAGSTGRVSSISSATLAELGVIESSSVLTKPNWDLIGILLAIFVVLILIILFSLCCLQHVGWGTAPAKDPLYRREAQVRATDRSRLYHMFMCLVYI